MLSLWKVRKEGIFTMNRKVLICLIVFLIIYFAWCALLMFAVAKRKPKREKKYQFDERQVSAQGTAYKWAFWTMLVYYLLYATVSGAAGIVWCDQFFGMFLGVLVGVTAFAMICVFQDAYFRPDQSKASGIILINLLTVCQGIIGLTHLSDGTVIEDGLLTADALQLFILLMGLVLDVAFIVKHSMDKRE